MRLGAKNTAFEFRNRSTRRAESDSSLMEVSPKIPVKLWLLDMGKGEIDGSAEHWPEPNSINMTDNVYALSKIDDVDLVVHVGDIAYAVGYAAQWDERSDSSSVHDSSRKPRKSKELHNDEAHS